MSPVLHDYVLSASCYKVRLLAALLGVRLKVVAVDFHPGREHQGAAFRALNPAGTLPVLTDGDLVLTDSAAIMVHLARLHGPDWLGEGEVVHVWLDLADRLNRSLGRARLHDMLNLPADIDACRRDGITCLRALEAHLTERRFAGQLWLVGTRTTIADIACFPNVALAADGGVSLNGYPSIRLWLRAIRALPGFVPMPGIYPLHEARP